jgi:hypothetical protein
MKTYAALPMMFEANSGQTDTRVKFLARAPGYTLFLTDKEAVLSLPAGSPAPASPHQHEASPGSRRVQSPGASKSARVVRLKFVGASTPTAITGRDQLPGKANYFIGNDPKQWHTNVPNYEAVEYRSVYPGVDAVFHGDSRRLEFDFDVAPGADPHIIALEVDGARRLRLNRTGDVVLGMDGAHDLVMGKPHIYQQSPEGRREIAGHYVLSARNRIAFALNPYDRAQPLVIDPTLDYSTYLGGGISQESYANAIAVDSSGDAYVTGAAGADTVPFPTTPGSYNPGPVPTKGNFPFISKLKMDGSGLVYSTYFGGDYQGFGGDQIFAIAVDSTGAAYFGGISGTEDNTPTTPGAFMPVRPSLESVPFVAKLSADGSTLVYSTFLDGTPHSSSDDVLGIAVDSSGSAYVTGITTALDFPTTPGAFQTVNKASIDIGTAFVTKLSADGSSLVYSTYLGGSTGEDDSGATFGTGAIAVDASGSAYVTGVTLSANFPTTAGALNTTCNSPCDDAFVSKLNPSGTGLVYSTFLGGTGNKYSVGSGIAVDLSGSAFVGGKTTFTNFPVTSNVVQSSAGPGFILKLTPDGTGLVYSSYFNGYVDSVAVGPDDSAVIFGLGNTSFAFESTADAFTLPPCTTGSCFYDFISKLTADGSALFFSSPIGANLECCTASGALDPSGNAYIAGSTGSLALPTTAGAFEQTLPSNYTGFTPFVAKVSLSSATSLTISPSTLPSGTAGALYSQTLTATGGTGTVTFAVTAGAPPPGLTLTSAGVLSGTPTQTGTFPFTVTATDSIGDTGSQAYTLTIGAACSTITVGPSTLASGTSGTAYPAVTFTESGGVGTTTLSESGALPTGMSFVAGVLSGTPTQTGSFPITVTATDSNGCTGSVSVTLTVVQHSTATTTTITSTASSFKGFALPTNVALVGNPVTVNFKVQPASGSASATGTVKASDGFNPPDSCPGALTAGAGSCALTISQLGSGSTPLAATYSPDANSSGLLSSTSSPAVTENLVQIANCGTPPSAQTSAQGTTVTYTLSICLAGDVQAVPAAVVTDCPPAAQCSATITPVLNQPGVYSVVVTIVLGGTGSSVPLQDPRPWSQPWPLILFCFGMFLAIVMALQLARQNRARPRLLYAAGFLIALLLSGISGCTSAGLQNTGGGGTPPNTYTVNVKMTAGNFSTTVPLTLTVTK